jgi:hypothetical protein
MTMQVQKMKTQQQAIRKGLKRYLLDLDLMIDVVLIKDR